MLAFARGHDPEHGVAEQSGEQSSGVAEQQRSRAAKPRKHQSRKHQRAASSRAPREVNGFCILCILCILCSQYSVRIFLPGREKGGGGIKSRKNRENRETDKRAAKKLAESKTQRTKQCYRRESRPLSGCMR